MRQRLERALELLEYVTHHDGRYDQHRGPWQREAQRFVHELRAFLEAAKEDEKGGTT
jgi:hypothetical protein